VVVKRVVFCVLALVALDAGASAESPRPPYFGAIAFNIQTRGLGLAWNFPEQWEAENFALGASKARFNW